MPRQHTYHFVFTSFLLFAFLAQHFSANLIMVDYVLRTEAYARNCVNKAKPMLHCKGKCQMMRKMTAQEQQNPAMPETPSVKLNIWCQLLHEEIAGIYALGTDASVAWAQQRKNLIPSRSCPGIFHPPRLVA